MGSHVLVQLRGGTVYVNDDVVVTLRIHACVTCYGHLPVGFPRVSALVIPLFDAGFE
jgi:hypothetical protein